MKLKLLILIAVTCLTSLAAQGASATLAWDASPSTSIANYSLYVGTSSGVYNVSTNKVGLALSASVNNLVEGVTYYFAATATDSFGQESSASNEIVYTVPRSRLLPPVNLRKVSP